MQKAIQKRYRKRKNPWPWGTRGRQLVDPTNRQEVYSCLYVFVYVYMFLYGLRSVFYKCLHVFYMFDYYVCIGLYMCLFVFI